MRFLPLLALALLIPAASAQVRQGSYELGGTASLVSNGDDTNLTLNPTIGYFFTDAVEVGGELFYFTDGDGNLGSFGPFAAYHFGRRQAKTRPFAQVGVGIALTGDSGVTANGAVGLKYFFLPGGALRGQAFVLAGDNTVFGVSGGVSIFL